VPSKYFSERSPLAIAYALMLAGSGLTKPETAYAIDVEAALQHTSEYTSNTLRTETDEIGEWVHQPGADLRVAEDTATLEMDVDYSYIRRIYTKDIWQDENRLTGLAAIDWHALADRLDFFVNNSRTESTEQALQTATQANRQIVSTTEAGSRLRFQPRSADEFQIEYLFRDSQASRTETDSQRHNGTLRYLMGLSENRALVAAGTYSDIEYEGPFPDAEYAVVTLGYLQEAGPIDLEINVGYNWYERDGRGRTDDPMYSGSLTWEATPTATFTLTGSRMITDAGSGLSSGDTASENTGINAAFEETTGRIGWDQTLGANTITLGGYWTRQEYAEDIPLTNTRVGGRFDYRRSLTRTTTFQLYADLSNRDFRDEGDDQDELRTGFRVDHRLGRSLNLNWGVRYEKRDAVTTESYEEWIGSIQIYWTFWGARRTPS
jgi:hypothetical protein